MSSDKIKQQFSNLTAKTITIKEQSEICKSVQYILKYMSVQIFLPL